MKWAIIAVVILTVMLGLGYGLAKLGVIPVRSMAKGSPGMAKVLVGLKLVRAEDFKPPSAAAPQPIVEKPKPILLPPPTPPKKKIIALAPKETGLDRLAKIFSTLDAGEIAPILSKLSDDELMKLFAKMNDQQVGEALLALPSEKAVVLSKRMASLPVAR